MGRMDAVNLETKKVVWMDRQRAPLASAMLATAGGLLFSGSQNRQFTAYDAATGKALWEVGLERNASLIRSRTLSTANSVSPSFPAVEGRSMREWLKPGARV